MRLLTGLNAAKDEDVARVFGVMEKVLRNVAVRILLEGVSDDPESDVSKLLGKLRERPNMHFVTQSPTKS